MTHWTVAKDGGGDFSSVQAAVDAAAPGDQILILPGVYRERVVIGKDGLHLRGLEAETTVIAHAACARDRDESGKEKGTFLSFTMLVAGADVTLENLTVRNDAGDGAAVGQAVALYAAGDRGLYRRCRLIACQDTLFCGPVMEKVLGEIAPREAGGAPCVLSVGDCPTTFARQYFEDCFIQGDVDFIFGPYRCWFEGCTLHMNARGGWYTAPNTPAEQPFGFVFHLCRLTGDCPPGAAYLGRPWRKDAAAAFLGCRMDACVSPRGFADWDQDRVVTARLQEGGTVGARGDTSPRHPREKILSEEDMALITRDAVLGDWRPHTNGGRDA